MGKYTNLKLCVNCFDVFDYKGEILKLDASRPFINKVPALKVFYEQANGIHPNCGLCFDCFCKELNISLASSTLAFEPVTSEKINSDNSFHFDELLNVPSNIPEFMKPFDETERLSALSENLKEARKKGEL